MRLICGVISLDGSDAPPARLQAMCDGLGQPFADAHVDLWHEGSAGLAVLDFASPDSTDRSVSRTAAGSVLAADVRLDELLALARSLGVAEQDGDALTAAALDRWGDSAPAELLGDFALACWNPNSRELLLARDIAGVRPLVYHHAPGRHFLFASFPAGIHASGLLPRELDEAALIHSMYLGYSKVETWSRGVVALPPASTLSLRDGHVEVKEYWRPTVQPRRHKTPAEAAEELRSLFTHAVETRLPTSGPVAAHLSGGLDSSGVAIVAARSLRAQGRKLLAYSFLLRPEERAFHEDETPYVEAVLAQEQGIEWTPVHAMDPARAMHSRQDPDRGLLLDETDTENAVCRDASARGAQMLLSGWGGDEGATFNGRGMLAHAFMHGRWAYLVREMQAQRRERGFGLRSLVLRQVLLPSLPARFDPLLARLLGAGISLVNKPDLIAPGPLSKEQHILDDMRVGSSLRRTQLALLSSGHLSTRTTNWARTGARYGMAFAFPMLDRRLQEFALSVPATWHVRKGWRRRPYRDAMQGILPPLIQWRHDKLAPLPQTDAAVFSQRAAMLARFEALAEHPRMRSIFNLEEVRSLLTHIPRGGAGAGNTDAAFLYACGSIALHYMTYIAEHF